MPRCSGGPSQNSKRRSGRMHLNGDEDSCAKHASDNFSFMSTVSRVAARNLAQAQPAPPLTMPGMFGGDNVDGTETERATSLPSTLPAMIARSQSRDSTSGQTDTARDRSRSLPDDREDAVAVLLGVRRISYRSNLSFWIAAIILLTIVAYAYYRWFYRAEFRYQTDVLRELYGLQSSKEFWF